ncbi:hypothetical protein [Clostridium thermarum]|uniref:hypothetical protein n=1 Tax=Clostridium thermarum TaxID=1716543 RepID=UPI001124AF45|nr:hypothetical protein [Clostridium thermarum]
MLDKKQIIKFLEDNDLTDVEELEYKDDALVVRFYYDFDSDELASARAYANDECEDEQESDEWYDEFFLTYLNEIAVDNAGEIIEELMEEFELQAQYITYEADKESYDYCEFIAVISEVDKNYNIEDVLDELEL